MQIEPASTTNTFFNHPKIKEFYYAGNLNLLLQPKVCIIGSRKISSYGQLVVENFVKNLVGTNLVTVSGFVDGVDFEVFLQSINYNIPTIAVLGYGFNYLNLALIKKAKNVGLQNTLFISEFSLDQNASTWTFPKRDETLAYISDIILVVEAAEKSGTFYTVKRAFKENKKVYACVGSIFSPNSKGIFKLLQTGFSNKKALLYTSSQDILSNFSISSNLNKKDLPIFSVDQQTILNTIAGGGINFDDLLKFSKLNYSTLIVLLMELEVLGAVTNKNGKYYRS